jgi:dipeptidyl aminopeptidase/acylaminoacyl peptidase
MQAVAVVALASVVRPTGLAGRGKSPHGLRGTDLHHGLLAQTKRPMTLVDIVEYSRLLDPQLSPDGAHLLYQLHQTDWKADGRTPHIWRQDIGGGAPVQLTFGENGETTPRWSPDGKTISFLRGGQVYLLPADGGEARQLTRHATSVFQAPGAAPAWARDASAMYFTATDAATNDERERTRLKDDVLSFEESSKPRHLWKVIVSTGTEQPITKGDLSVLSYRLSRDGARIALQRAPSTLAADDYRGEVWVMDASGDNARALTSNSVDESDAELSPDNSQVLFLSGANERFDPYYNAALFVVPAAGGAPRMVAPGFPHEVVRASWSPDGRSIFADVNMGVHSEVFQIELNGRVKQMTDGRHSIPPAPSAWTLVPAAGQIVMQFDEPTRAGDVWTLPIGGGTPARITGVFDSFERDFRLPREEKIEWKSADGTPIEGLLLYPLDYEAGRRYPLVVQLHGGPGEADKFSFGTGWAEYFQVLTAKGYAVLKPNYRGSSGYGSAFLRGIVGDYFKHQPGDVLSGVDFLVKQGIADPDRLVVMGWSAGGHLTNKLITVTDRFKAASSGAGVANWTSFFAQTDTRANRTVWFGGTPWQKNAPIDVYWDNSPLKYVVNVKTPTLLIVGENDSRVPKEQAIEMHRALKANGVPTKLLIGPREGHTWFGLRHQLYKMNAELEWFEKYAMGRTYVWERAPGDPEPKVKSSQP